MRDTAQWYRDFAEGEARGRSALYEEWALGVADDAGLRELIDGLPLQKRQPNLVFAVARLLGAPEVGYPRFRSWVIGAWPRIVAELPVRMTQTNEPRRCASLLPALSLIPGPLALLEVGASAGLCLYPDRYSYSYDGIRVDPADGPSAVLLESETNGGVPIPRTLPEVVWRCGIDLYPLDVRDESDMLWLETLLWPEQQTRRERLRAAVDIAREEPPTMLRGDARDALAEAVTQAPGDARLVIVSSGVLVYLVAEQRQRFAEMVRGLDADWVSLEGRAGLPVVEAALPDDGLAHEDRGRFVLALNEHPLAYTGPHGQRLDWF
ncbi:MAG TPA: DUF2332 domain-containing protein [Lacisediminihabitans sp.]|uniref:DUF2332 domain-containing protein n=1 Tax=Lacisediminihabitans sp. TaxID=2787631 RepID=UPI002ED81188